MAHLLNMRTQKMTMNIHIKEDGSPAHYKEKGQGMFIQGNREKTHLFTMRTQNRTMRVIQENRKKAHLFTMRTQK
jgi:hypothetical protein